MILKTIIRQFGMLAFVITLFGCNSESLEQKEEQKVRPVKWVSTGIDNAVEVSKFPAVVTDNELVELSFPFGGRIASFEVQSAQSLKKGDVIAKLDQRELVNNLDKAQAQSKNAEIEYQRAGKLLKSKAISQSAYQERVTSRDVSRSQLNVAKQALTDSVLRAPFDGVIASKMSDEGQAISGGQTAVIFIGGAKLEASIDLPADYLAALYQSEFESRTIESFITLDIAPKTSIQAIYKEATLLADTATQTYTVTFEFKSPKGVLVLPGMNGTIEVQVGASSHSNNITLPLAAITSDGESTYVWVVDKQNMTVTKRIITVAEGVGSTLIAESGLDKGELVVSAGVAYLYEGMKVREWK
ncbi:RND family efflux transporter MFP subunit [Vibrio crassostreae]|uniref:efflux RND transporter periplasmic adaptor subunit n=1 Tax=Vibrio crassostreae TaxID=246167 RepID=UPI000636BEF6|nr:efflux RND transporter periplasmic adaptor subunit [Vibrio crassostreae]ROR19000.1 RND family efflux transporter MFP subunit [Vibrio crassostreae]TCN66981.1 RND family efflux transporter MFP subunit [Vibrio crassostreae]TCO00581.1 RND family efflux transporter MFP subunit [Vibrio crassostreae]TWD43228.1 RND family efflux transporter MFP subunit [Vibrio crassostreae]CAK1825361.1 RND family efflux transporter MFP subunit [Vibrio crassostreae]